MESKERIIGILEKIENVVAQYDDVAGDIEKNIRAELKITSVSEMEQKLESIFAENRLLNIGIVGRVKSGKSSLLNAVFFDGKQVLPKAATPMTAALTVMTYGDTFGAEIDFFSQDDINIIKREHDSYEKDFEKRFAEAEKDAKERAKKKNISYDAEKTKRIVKQDMENDTRTASYDQYERMKNVSVPNKNDNKIAASNETELMAKLGDYVGANGKYMPYTKSVKVFLKRDNLKDIQVVDTPGVNDPIKSREKRTEDYLGNCDVVFIVSPAGQFLTSEDTSLMTHISTKEGVSELYLVASQCDNELYASEKEAGNGILSKVVEHLRQTIAEQSSRVLIELKNDTRKGIGGQFDQLIEGGQKRLMATSAICYSMAKLYDDRSKWDEDMNHAWELLTDDYPDFFNSDESAKANLDMLGGIPKVIEKIEDVRAQKNEIIEKRQGEYLDGQAKNANEFYTKLKAELAEKKDVVANGDAESLKKEKENIEQLCKKGSTAVDLAFEDCLDRFKMTLGETIRQAGKAIFAQARNDTDSAEEIKTKHKQESRLVEKSGFGSGIARFFGGLFGTDWGYRTEHYDVSYDVTTVRAGAVTRSLNDMIADLQESMQESVDKSLIDWKQDLPNKIISSIRSAVDNDELIDITLLKDALRRMINSMEIPELDFSSYKFDSAYSGTLEDDEAESFLDSARQYISEVRQKYDAQQRNFITTMTESARKQKISDSLFDNLRKQIDDLEKQVANKDMTIDRIQKCLKLLEEI